ncbi:MAG: transcriptional regulator GcvA [Thalassobaculaceae bacterium]|nr:transcriptional regulator GcvA [Thalassobaculaceae bacterium]
MDTLPPLTALRAFEAVAMRLSVKGAAEALSITPSALSHQLRVLEDTLGLKLFHRLNRRLLLTDAGQVYFSKIAPAFETLRTATAEIAERGRADTLVVTAPASFAEIWLLPRLPRFLDAHPEVDLRIEATSRPIDYAREAVDASIRYGTGPWPGLASHRLVSERLVALCAPDLLQGPRPLRSPADLAHHTLIHSDQRLTGWTSWLRAHGQAGLRGARNLRFSQSAHSLRAAVQGLGVVLENRVMAQDALAADALVEPFPELAPVDDGVAYHLVAPADRLTMPKVRALVAWLEEEAKRPVSP